MAHLHLISTAPRETAIADVVFLHGLSGDIHGTWQGKEPAQFWPAWLANEFQQAAVWLVGYDAPIIGKGGMPYIERAINILDRLDSEGLGQKPLCFVAHSFGGILVKQMLREAEGSSEKYRHVIRATRRVVFIATPHTGSALANVAKAIGVGSRTTVELTLDDIHLRELNRWYRSAAVRLGIATAAYYETLKTKGWMVVDVSSGDPVVPDVTAVPLDGDHISICKPESPGSPSYLSWKAFLAPVLSSRSVAINPACPSSLVPRIHEERIELYPTREGSRHWLLSLPFEVPSEPAPTQFEIFLDNPMRAILPSSYALKELSPKRGTLLPEIHVAENLRTIRFDIDAPPLGSTSQTQTANVVIDFEWWMGKVPQWIDLKITAGVIGNQVIESKVVRGVYLGQVDDLRSLLCRSFAPGASRFYFPSNRPVVVVPAVAMAELAPMLQRFPHTTMRSVTWFSEAEFWTSEIGTNYLSSQIERMLRPSGQQQPERPERIAVCPLMLGRSVDSCRSFFQELEAQARLGIAIRIVSPIALEGAMRHSDAAPTAYGDSVGFIYDGIQQGITGEQASVFFSQKDVSDVRGLYDDLWNNSEQWSDYMRIRGVHFSPEQESEIEGRRGFVLSEAKHAASILG